MEKEAEQDYKFFVLSTETGTSHCSILLSPPQLLAGSRTLLYLASIFKFPYGFKIIFLLSHLTK